MKHLEGLFQKLGLEPTNDLQKVRAHFRKLLRKYHPDLHVQNKFFYEEKTKELLHIYETIKEALTAQEPLFEEPREEPEPPLARRAYLQFEIDHRLFGFPVSQVVEVADGRGLQKEGFFLGRIVSRGDTIPVFSARSLFHLPQSQPPLDPLLGRWLEKVIVLEAENRKAGLLVEKVQGVVAFSPEDFVSHPSIPSLNPYLEGTVIADEKIVFLLSPIRILRAL